MNHPANGHLPETGFVRLSVVLAHVPVGKSTWWAGVQSGRFPKLHWLGPRITAWRAEDIHQLIADLGRVVTSRNEVADDE